MPTLSERQKKYEESYSQKIIRRVPIVIRIDGKNFSRITKDIDKPFCSKLSNIFLQTMILSVKEMEGCVFAYTQSDEISFVLRNDQSINSEPWFDNEIQKIVSVSSSIVTYHFCNTFFNTRNKPKLLEPVLFDSRIIALPNIIETVNYLIGRQLNCISNSIANAADEMLSKKFGKEKSQELLLNKSVDDKEDLLFKHCGIDFETYYPDIFKYGAAVYRIPKIIETENGQITRQRWSIDDKLPFFVDNQKFLHNILSFGKDIFRPERDLK